MFKCILLSGRSGNGKNFGLFERKMASCKNGEEMALGWKRETKMNRKRVRNLVVVIKRAGSDKKEIK